MILNQLWNGLTFREEKIKTVREQENKKTVNTFIVKTMVAIYCGFSEK